MLRNVLAKHNVVASTRLLKDDFVTIFETKLAPMREKIVAMRMMAQSLTKSQVKNGSKDECDSESSSSSADEGSSKKPFSRPEASSQGDGASSEETRGKKNTVHDKGKGKRTALDVKRGKKSKRIHSELGAQFLNLGNLLTLLTSP